MNTALAKTHPPKRPPTVWSGLVPYLGYLAVFFTVWTIQGVDYNRIGENAETIRRWYATPTLCGCAFLVTVVAAFGWWRPTLFEPARAGPRWVWILPVAMGGIILNHFLGVPTGALSAPLVWWSTLGAVGVGFGEEMITRGTLIVGLRSRFGENRVWLISTLLFSAMHVPNVLFGLPAAVMPIQVALTFVMGSGLYAIRRISGTLLLPMVLHGLWDSSLFLNIAAGTETSPAQFIIYPLCIIGVIAVLRHGQTPAVNPPVDA